MHGSRFGKITEGEDGRQRSSVAIVDEIAQDEHAGLPIGALREALQEIMARELTELPGSGPSKRTRHALARQLRSGR